LQSRARRGRYALLPYTTLFRSETAYSEAFEMAKLTSKAEMYSDRRSEAKLSWLPLERELNDIKAQLHHAERLQDALKAKLSGYQDRKSTRLNSSHVKISYAVFC